MSLTDKSRNEINSPMRICEMTYGLEILASQARNAYGHWGIYFISRATKEVHFKIAEQSFHVRSTFH